MGQPDNMATCENFKLRLLCFSLFFLIVMIFSEVLFADVLFKGRNINIGDEALRTFTIGVTGTTAGHNYIALKENARQDAISLGELGFWERVPDPPSYLRNYDLQIIIENNYKGRFLIEFKYIEEKKDLHYLVKEGDVLIKINKEGYYPKLIIDSMASLGNKGEESIKEGGKGRLFFFDFNCFDVDLRKYYGKIKEQLKDKSFTHYFYYYESGNYNSYYFKVYANVNEMDTDKMGLSSENSTLKYYQDVLDNIRSHFGKDFKGSITIVTRFGNKFSYELKKYASEIVSGTEVDVNILSYDDIPL